MKYKQLTSEQRYAIKLGLQAEMTFSAIAKQISVSVSTISREVKRNKILLAATLGVLLTRWLSNAVKGW